MSHPAAKLSLAAPALDDGHATAAFPRARVLWAVLVFCLSSWSIVIFAVTRFV